jgi:hypothetical protein
LALRLGVYNEILFGAVDERQVISESGHHDKAIATASYLK